MPQAHVRWPHPPPRLQTQEQSAAQAWGWGWGFLAGWQVGALTIGDLSELKEQRPGISGAGVLKVNRRVLRTQLVSNEINENKPCSGLSQLD